MTEKTSQQIAAEVAKLEAHLDDVKPRLMHFPNVIDVYTGIKTVGGFGTDTACFIVEVSKKHPEADLPSDARIPSTIDGFPIDVF